MQDVKLENLELFYDVLDESNNLLYEVFHKPYFELLEMTVSCILEGEITIKDLEDDKRSELQAIIDKLEGVDFSVEDVRKAMQSIVLRGFKEERIPNGNTTPDTLGILFAYLITKLNSKKKIKIADPLCGTGNLLLTINNHLECECELYACDNDPLMTKITAMSSDLIDKSCEIFLQDSLSLNITNMDVVVFDLPHSEYSSNAPYFPYDAVLYYSGMLKENGGLIGIVENDFFEYDKDLSFKNELFKTMSIIGLIELPDEMFKAGKPKLIIVMQKKLMDNKNCFMVKLPNFTNAKEFNNSLIDIEAWFEKNSNK